MSSTVYEVGWGSSDVPEQKRYFDACRLNDAVVRFAERVLGLDHAPANAAFAYLPDSICPRGETMAAWTKTSDERPTDVGSLEPPPAAALCLLCRKSFSEAESKDSAACPSCGSIHVPADPRKKHTLTLTAHEWRVLFSWAGRWAESHREESAAMPQIVAGIAAEARRQQPNLPSLSLRAELQECATALGNRLELHNSAGGAEVFQPATEATAAAPRCGDHVLHKPSGETWVVAWCEGDDLAWCGWPNGIARTSDCQIVHRASDAEHRVSVQRVAQCGDSRGPRVRGLYPEALR